METTCVAVLYDGTKFGELSMMGTNESKTASIKKKIQKAMTHEDI